jgi:hypothetical protein
LALLLPPQLFAGAVANDRADPGDEAAKDRVPRPVAELVADSFPDPPQGTLYDRGILDRALHFRR